MSCISRFQSHWLTTFSVVHHMLNWLVTDQVNIFLKRVFQTLKNGTQKVSSWGKVVASAGSASPGVVCEDAERAANCLDNQMILVID